MSCFILSIQHFFGRPLPLRRTPKSKPSHLRTGALRLRLCTCPNQRSFNSRNLSPILATPTLLLITSFLILSNLVPFQNLVKFLYTGRNILTVLLALACLAQHNASAFQKQEKEISSYIKNQLFKAKLSSDPNSLYEKSGCHVSFDCKIKIYGLKVLVKSLWSKKIADGRPQIASLLDILFRLLKKGEFTEGSMMCEIDMAHLRLAAAKSVLRLSRRWDLHVSPQIFQATIMMAKDDSPFVRRLYLDKKHRLLKEHASKYACAFPLAASDCVKDLQDASSSYLVDLLPSTAGKLRWDKTQQQRQDL